MTNYAQVGIGTENPDESAVLELQSTEKGFLPPRMSTLERVGINIPVEGLVIYNTDNNCLQWYIGNGIWHDACGVNLYQKYPDETIFCESGPTEIVDVVSSTGKEWMDRNLGATQVATASNDVNSYGDLYQWGRRSDGHQCRTSPTTTTLSSSDQPGNVGFIIAPSSPFDWRSPQNTDLWQGVNGVNNPCPSGYRLPTDTEWNDERLSWGQAPISSTNDAAGAFASPLKLPVADFRSFSNGSFGNAVNWGRYWSSTVSSTSSRGLFFDSSDAYIHVDDRASGFSVRCIKD